MKLIQLSILPVFVLLAGCGGQAADEAYPDVTTRPERPEANLSAERREALEDELRQVREDAVRYATEGRPETEASDDSAPDVIGDDAGSPEPGTAGVSESE